MQKAFEKMSLSNHQSSQPRLFGLQHSNRNFTRPESWGKNCFNSSFPAALSIYLESCNFKNCYLKLDSNLQVQHSEISTQELYGCSSNLEDLFYAFESQFSPYQQYVIGTLPNVDLVTQSRTLRTCLNALEIKLTALPDHTTCDLTEDRYSCELVIRPDTIVYLACRIADRLSSQVEWLQDYLEKANLLSVQLSVWAEAKEIIPYTATILRVIDHLLLRIINDQLPLLMQPVWKTQGKSPQLSDYCLDVFVWSDLALTRLFIDRAKADAETGFSKGITRHMRSAIWLLRMIQEFAMNRAFDHGQIIDSLSYNTKNDKAFSINGLATHRYLKSDILTRPRIHQSEIKNIILGGGQNLLSPERRFDAIIYNSPSLFH